MDAAEVRRRTIRPVRGLIRRLLFPMVLEPAAEDLLRFSEVRDAMRRLAGGSTKEAVVIDGKKWEVVAR